MSARGISLRALARVRVGSHSPPKLAAVRDAVLAYAPSAVVTGVAVASGVAEQPVGWEEIVRGARNRATHAFATDEPPPAPDRTLELGVGIEDGLVSLHDGGIPGGYVNVGCAAITDGRRVSVGFSSGFAYPPECSERAVRERAPIGALFDALWERRRSPASPAGTALEGASAS